MAGPTTLFQTGIHSARPAASAGCVLYSCTTHGLIYKSDGASWTTFLTLTAAGAVATDAIWDAAGDLAVGSGADTAAKLAKGSAGGALSIINSAVAWNSGTSFPGSKATGDRFWRTDLGGEYYWDGTNWLSSRLYFAHDGILVITAALTESQRYVASAGTDVWVVAWDGAVGVFGTNNGSNFWTLQLGKRNTSDTATSISTTTTAAVTASTWTPVTTAVGASVAVASFPSFTIQASVKTGTPANCLFIGGFSYRLIAT